MRRTKTNPGTLDGAKWRNSHQRTVDSVLTKLAETRSVRSHGSQFYNKDSWTARAFVAALCEWARLNPESAPNRWDVESWVYRANAASVPDYDKGIVIAATPDDLPKWLAYALVGGGYHEAWHTLYSRRTPLNINEVWPKVLDLWKLVPYAPEEGKKGWAGLTKALLDWGNIIEDIRIERCGCKEFPGSPEKMENLQDLILKQEEAGMSVSEHRGVEINHDLSVVVGTFRDLGLGYETPDQNKAIRLYEERSPAGFAFVTEGPLKPLLDRSIALGPKDDLGHLWLAMEVVAAIVSASQAPQEEAPPPPQGGEGSPPPPQQGEPKQQEASDFQDPPPEGGEGEAQPQSDKPLLYKLGDRAVLKVGPYKGQTVEVVRASLPHPETGIQRLEYALVEDE